ncbi:MAG: CoB--CoM heterodisulfide reductase iron-sulfur subunit B family protein [Clostridia bacterium]|nr:CoB--CoM heterodisulfide reductase iron-sulfur subunit B family protein [Clostridia bacterium]
MIYSYYPGCTLKDRAKQLDVNARSALKAMGIELKELDTWQCCGAVYPQASDEIASRLSAVRALSDAENGKLVTLCSACHHVLKRTNYDWNQDTDFKVKATNYLKPETPYDGSTQVIHVLELIRDEIGFENLKKMVVNPLTGRKIGAFYGCMVLRPGKALAFDDPENPTIIEDFIKALGAEPVKYAYRNECCGAYVALEDKSAAETQVDRALNSAVRAGCEELITACPLCLYNLVHNATANKLPVKYFTELLPEALGVKEGE